MMHYLYLTFGLMAGFVSGLYFNNVPPEVKVEEDCSLFEVGYAEAVKNCVKSEGWEDYECFRYLATGRAPATPTPKPTPHATARPSFWDMPKYKPYVDDSESESSQEY